MTTYFKFDIPTNEDGSRISYSPGWCGTMPKVPSGVTVDLYNDKEGYGIAHTEDVLPKEVKPLDAKEAACLLSSSINQLTAGDEWKPIFLAGGLLPKDAEYKCNTVEERWGKAVKELEAEPDKTTQAVMPQKAVFCSTCHVFITWLPSSIKTATINLTCPMGHKVALNGE